MKTRTDRKKWMILAVITATVSFFSGCAAMNRRPEALLPDLHTFRTGPFRIHTHKPIKPTDPLVAELESLSRSVAQAIGEPPGNAQDPVDMYLLKDEDSFRHYLKFFHPELPPRRAYFIATETSRTIYTFLGDHLMEDLRHEATHALVNLSHPMLPLWLDEGLAESFEHPDRSAQRDTHIDKFLADVKAGSLPDLARLERITDVRDMTPRDYRESWAWVQWGLAGPEPVRTTFDRYIRSSTSQSAVGSPDHTSGRSLSSMWNEVAPQLNPQSTPMIAWLTRAASAPGTEIVSSTTDPQLRQARLQNLDIANENRDDLTPKRQPHGNGKRRPGFFRRLFGF